MPSPASIDSISLSIAIAGAAVVYTATLCFVITPIIESGLNPAVWTQLLPLLLLGLVAGIIAAVFVSTSITKPIRDIVAKVDNVDLTSANELDALARSIRGTLTSLAG